MTSLAFAAQDSATMLGREIKHSIRLLRLLIVSVVLVPVAFLLLFDYILGGTIGNGLGSAGHGSPYIDFLLPGILMMTVAGGCGPTAINVTMDMTTGFVDRIRTMAVSSRRTAHRPRRRQPRAYAGCQHRGHWSGTFDRIPAEGIDRGVVRCRRNRRGIRICLGVALRRHRPGREKRCGRERVNAAPVVPASVPVQHLRSGGLNACWHSLVRGHSALHCCGRQPARPPVRRAGW